MIDDRYLSVIDHAFAGFRSGGSLTNPFGPEAARITADRRRRIRTMVGTAIVALIMLAGSLLMTK